MHWLIYLLLHCCIVISFVFVASGRKCGLNGWVSGTALSCPQGRSQPHSPREARDPLSSLFPESLINFSYFSSNFTYFLPHFGPPGGRVAHPGRPRLRHCLPSLVLSCLVFVRLFVGMDVGFEGGEFCGVMGLWEFFLKKPVLIHYNAVRDRSQTLVRGGLMQKIFTAKIFRSPPSHHKKKKKKKKNQGPLFAMKITGQQHRKARKLNF